MDSTSGPYIVIRRDDGYGDVIPLQAGQRFTLGRANTNRIVLKDELCSREHAEVYFAEERWRLRDQNSLNGTRINSEPLDVEWELSSGDEFQVGRTRFIFVDQLNELPEITVHEAKEALTIKRRLSHSRFMTPQPAEPDALPLEDPKRRLSRDLLMLYQLGLEMGSAANYEELARTVLAGLLRAVSAEIGAILTLKDNRELEPTCVLPESTAERVYSPVSEFVTHEVLSQREAVLAEDVARSRYLSQRDSLKTLGATSIICAPVLVHNKVYALIHLYCTDPHRALGNDDLDLTVAVAKHMANGVLQLERAEQLAHENRQLRMQLRVESDLVGDSEPIRHILSQIGQVADTNATVLIRGESGVGKELVARSIHFNSPRKNRPLVCLNCAAITETLLESELFGHERGSFTGATDKKIGKFEAAHQGTIFLDEIGEMTPNTQAKLLRVLEGHSFERVGGGTPIRVDVRVVAATNQPLEKAIQEGKFRKDLFYRLQVVEIRVPPLRERREDILKLADYFLKRFLSETGRRIKGFTPAAMLKLEQYDWPGNVRELRNVIERTVALCRGNQIDAPDVWLSSLADEPRREEAKNDFEPLSLEEIEKRHIERTLRYTDWNKSQASSLLHIERSTLDRKIKAYQLRRGE